MIWLGCFLLTIRDEQKRYPRQQNDWKNENIFGHICFMLIFFTLKTELPGKTDKKLNENLQNYIVYLKKILRSSFIDKG